MSFQYIFIPVLFLLKVVFSSPDLQKNKSVLTNKVICIDPGHGGTAATDSFRKGAGGEREEWINLRVALLLKEMLERKGAKVLLTRSDDSAVSFDDRINLAISNKADVFLSIHHNATADTKVNFPIIYFHGNASENPSSVMLGKAVARQLKQALFNNKTPVSLVSDHTIFPSAGTKVLRGTYGIPGIIAEASFFTNMAEEERLKSKKHTNKEATAFMEALENYFTASYPAIVPKNSLVQIIPFQAFQEAERMNPVARKWLEDFETGKKLFTKQDTTSLQEAYELFTRSVRSFPDSYIAAQCHQYRAAILQKLHKTSEALQEYTRVKELYVKVD